MISKNLLKEIILSNEDFILNKISNPITRKDIYIPLDIRKVVVFFGVRRSGKTFILYDLFKKNIKNSLYIDFEDERLSGFELKDFDNLKQVFFELKPHLIGKECFFLFDEIQNISGWEKFCRRLVEKEHIKVFITGSSSKMMPYEIHTELRGRVWSCEVMPFSFKEYLDIKGIDIEDKSYFFTDRRAIIKNYFNEYLRWGGFPEVITANNDFEKTKILKEYLKAMFFRDLIERYKITNLALFDALSDKLFSSFSTKLSLSTFYKQYKEKIPFSKDILFKYYKFFLNSMLIFEIRKFAESSYKKMRNPAKIYLVDTGLARHTSSFDYGRLLENLVYLHLKRKDYELFYFEEKNECDFIAKNEKSGFLPIQVAYELLSDNIDREIKGVVESAKWLNTGEGIIITYDDEKSLNVEGININVIPIWKFLLE